MELSIENLEKVKKLSDKYEGFYKLSFTFFDLIDLFGIDAWRWEKLFRNASKIKVVNDLFNIEKNEKELILKALEITDYVQQDAAELLGISSRAVNWRVKKYKITHSNWKKNVPKLR